MALGVKPPAVKHLGTAIRVRKIRIHQMRLRVGLTFVG